MSITITNVLCCMIQSFSFSSAYFDAGQFLNITDNRTIGIYNVWHLCFDPKGEYYKENDRCCSCELNCMETKTCCIDAFWNSTYKSRQKIYIQDFLDLSRQYKDAECSRLLPSSLFEGYIPTYYMITSCQDDSIAVISKGLQGKCLMGNVFGNPIEYYIPVKGNDNYLYRNQYCAICNSVPEFEMVTIDKGYNSDFDTFEIRLFHPNKTFPVCSYGHRTNRNCSRSNEFYDLCRSFSGPMGKYANFFCHLCNHGYVSEKISPDICYDRVVDGGPQSWASLLKFVFTDKADSTCTSGHVLDEKNQCTSFVCPVGYQAKNSKCVVIKVETSDRIDIKEASFDRCLFAGKPNMFIKNVLHDKRVLKELFSSHENDTYNKLISKIDNQYFIDGNSIHNFSISTEKMKDVLSVNGSIIFSQANLYLIVNYELNFSQIFPENKICAKPIPVILDPLNFTKSCDLMMYTKWIPSNNLSLRLIIDKDGLSREVYSCNKFYLSKPCPGKVLYKNNTFMNDTQLVSKNEGITYEPHEYAPYKDGSYSVCIDNSKDEFEPLWLSTVDKVSGYMSIVGSSFSLLCYLLLIVTVLQFKELRNVPGLCTLALSINLLIGDGLFLTANFMHMSKKYQDMTTLCDIIGISIHFFLLSAQMWGLVMAIDISVNLTKMSHSNQNKNSKFIMYNIVPFLFAAIHVTLALLFRAYEILDVSYNKGALCALHGFYSRIFLYFLPFLICFTVSAVSLTISLGKIAKERRKNKSILARSNKNNTNMIQVGLKLVIICGLTEGVGIIYIPTRQSSPDGILIVNSVFMVLYSFVKGFRGVMLFIVFICRKQVYEMYKRRYGRKNIKDKDSTMISATATTRM